MIFCETISNLKNNNLFGKVKSVKNINWPNHYKNEFGKLVGSGLSHYGNYLEKFNQNGNLIEIIDYHDSHSIKSFSKKYKYNNGNLIEIKRSRKSSQYNPFSNTIKSFIYDNLERLVEIEEHSYDGWFIESVKYIYNDDGRICALLKKSVKELKLDNYDFSQIFYKYDKKGNEIERTYFTDNIFKFKVLLKYDEINNRISETNFSSYGFFSNPHIFSFVPSSETNYKFNKNRKKIEQSRKNTILTIIDYFLLPNFSRLFTNYLKKSYFKYNSNGDVIEISANNTQDHNAKKTVYEYNYDKKGNWIKKISFLTYRGSEQVSGGIQERIISYYK